ncbi:hypothetical protein B0H11DRAFT_1735123, partial [Mycena galericulata]
GKGHPAKKRPTEIGDWVQRARIKPPAIAEPEEFGKQWWVWWIDINPAWRRTGTPMLRDRDGPWGCMDYYGQNAFLNVLMGLKWWRDALGKASKEWEEGVEDVTWVLQKMQS